MSSNVPTTLADEGFLSEEASSVIVDIRAKYEAWFSELRILNRLLVQVQYGLSIHRESAQEMVCAMLYMRVLVHSQATVLLIERGMKASARAMARCAIEALFKLGACAREPSKALALLDADEVDRLRQAKHLADVNDPKLRETVNASDLDQIRAHIQQNVNDLDAKALNIRTMAKAADLEDLYLTGYSYLCGAVHSSAGDIDEHCEADVEGKVCALVNEPIIDGLEMLCLMVGDILFQSSRALTDVFGVSMDACDESIKRLHSLRKEHQ